MQLFVQQHIQANIKENTKATHCWPLCKWNHRWPVVSPHKWSVMETVFPCRDVITAYLSMEHHDVSHWIIVVGVLAVRQNYAIQEVQVRIVWVRHLYLLPCCFCKGNHPKIIIKPSTLTKKAWGRGLGMIFQNMYLMMTSSNGNIFRVHGIDRKNFWKIWLYRDPR